MTSRRLIIVKKNKIMHKIYWYDFSFLKQKRSVGKKATQFICRRKTFRSEGKALAYQ